MNRLNRKLEYALMALQYLAERPEGTKVSTKEVCESTGSPFDATARVMQLMAQDGLLKSEQGVRGGYFLNKKLDEVNFLQLTETIMGPLELAKCIKSSSVSCDILDKCNIKTPIKNINTKFKEFYQTLTLDEVLSSNSREAILSNIGLIEFPDDGEQECDVQL